MPLLVSGMSSSTANHSNARMLLQIALYTNTLGGKEVLAVRTPSNRMSKLELTISDLPDV